MNEDLGTRDEYHEKEKVYAVGERLLVGLLVYSVLSSCFIMAILVVYIESKCGEYRRADEKCIHIEQDGKIIDKRKEKII